MRRLLAALALVAAASVLALGWPTRAAAQLIQEFPLGSSTDPIAITAGPDGNLWFTKQGSNSIGRITTAGAITEFSIPTASSSPAGIAAGPDGNLWFTEEVGNIIGRITTAGAITEFSIPGSAWAASPMSLSC
jgi:virginiamycin B lyase